MQRCRVTKGRRRSALTGFVRDHLLQGPEQQFIAKHIQPGRQ